MPSFTIPPLPDHPVRVGETWEVPYTRTVIESFCTRMSSGRIRARAFQTLTGFEERDGVRCARVSMVFAGALRRGDEPKDPKSYMKGTCEFLLGTDGYLREVKWMDDQITSIVVPFAPNQPVRIRLRSEITITGGPEPIAAKGVARDVPLAH